ncbi:hypothetical protein R1sor_013715 [Riccia sorocarpa]|uniref:Uncharacterized protein n=1 Tax=Riccia sorocarpa TaxID=122646 RepID=A0ABD3H9B6_9MARC
MLLLPSFRIPEVPTLDRLLQAWFSTKSHLSLQMVVEKLPLNLPIASLQKIWTLMGCPELPHYRIVEKEARKSRLSILGDLETNDGALDISRIFPEDTNIDNEREILREWLSQIRPVDFHLSQSENWSWDDRKQIVRPDDVEAEVVDAMERTFTDEPQNVDMAHNQQGLPTLERTRK